MSTEKSYTAEELYNDGLELLSNGHRMIYVFKYVRDRAMDEEMRQQVMERLTSNSQVQQVKEERLEQVAQKSDISWLDLGMGIFLICFLGYFVYVVIQQGRIPIFPIVICVAIGMGLLRNKF